MYSPTEQLGNETNCPITDRLSARIANMSLFAALLVVIIHAPFPSKIGSPTWMLYYFMRYTLGTIAVPYFFLVAGFFIARRYGERNWFGTALKKRVFSLLVPFVLWSTIIASFMPICIIFANALHSRNLNIMDAFSLVNWFCVFGFDPIEAVIPLWFLRALYILVLLSPVLLRLIDKFPCATLVGFYLIYYLVNPGHVDSNIWWIPTWWQSFFRHGLLSVEGLFYFTFGAFLFKHRIPLKDRDGLLIGAIGLAIGFLRMAFIIRGMKEPMPLIALSIPCVMIGVWKLVQNVRIPREITSCAFPLYLIHVIFVKVLWLAVSNTGYGNIAESCAGLIASWLFCTVCPIVCISGFRKYLPKVSYFVFGGR